MQWAVALAAAGLLRGIASRAPHGMAGTAGMVLGILTLPLAQVCRTAVCFLALVAAESGVRSTYHACTVPLALRLKRWGAG